MCIRDSMNTVKGKIAGALAAIVLAAALLFSGLATVGAPDTTVSGDPDTIEMAIDDLDCAGQYRADIEDAKKSYQTFCGQEWQFDSGFHRCDWHPAGWICGGPSSIQPKGITIV